jgi:valyl-tRNA synthetase
VSPAAGEKPDMKRPLSSAYDPKEVEDGWYAWWKKEGFFTPECVTTPDPPTSLSLLA